MSLARAALARAASPPRTPSAVTDIRCALPARALLGEGPLWDRDDRCLYWVDIKGCAVHRFDPATGRDTRWPTPETVGSLVRRERGGLVLALRSGFHSLDLDTGAIEAMVKPELDRPENRFNDGKPDRRGRFWAGSMHDPETAATGALYRLDPDGSCHRMVDGVVCSNALCWSPDGRTMYHADTLRRIVWAWDSDPDRARSPTAGSSWSCPATRARRMARPSMPRGSCGWRTGTAGRSAATTRPDGRSA